MIKRLTNFFRTHKHATIWTILYIAVIYLVLAGLFGFNIFSLHQWSILFRAELRGFAGFVFGILILAAVPMYIATTSIIVRTKKPLFEFMAKKAPTKQDKSAPEQEKKESEPIPPLPENIPAELRGPFQRARKNIGLRVASAFDIRDVIADKEPAPPAPTTDLNTAQPGGLPLPDSFDFGADDSAPTSSAPIFRDISFGDTDNDSKSADGTNKNQLHTYLSDRNIDFTVDDDITIANGMAIAMHDDPDFWIADDENWFAAGKQKPSPAATVIAAATKRDASPVLYLAEKNIMDLDNRVKEWESAGIRVITDLNNI